MPTRIGLPVANLFAFYRMLACPPAEDPESPETIIRSIREGGLCFGFQGADQLIDGLISGQGSVVLQRLMGGSEAGSIEEVSRVGDPHPFWGIGSINFCLLSGRRRIDDRLNSDKAANDDQKAGKWTHGVSPIDRIGPQKNRSRQGHKRITPNLLNGCT